MSSERVVEGGQVRGGGFAEFVAAPADSLVHRPDEVDVRDAATLGVAAQTALQGLRDWGQLQPGQRVLINGGSGGVGTFAVQLAKILGAGHVTAVCSTANVETARRLGADTVVDYLVEDHSATSERYDLFIDNAGTWSLGRCRRVLRPGGRFFFNAWDRIEENELVFVVMQALADLFPDDPPRFMQRRGLLVRRQPTQLARVLDARRRLNHAHLAIDDDRRRFDGDDHAGGL